MTERKKKGQDVMNKLRAMSRKTARALVHDAVRISGHVAVMDAYRKYDDEVLAAADRLGERLFDLGNPAPKKARRK